MAPRLLSEADLGAWPPANFDDWPGTRFASLVVDGLLLAAVLIVLAVPLCRRKAARCPTSSNLCCLVTTGIIIGVLGGMWLHFIPCIWWTCDWGRYDGQGVRGGIWFASGAVLGIIACSTLACIRTKERRGSAEPPLGPASSI